MIDVHIYSSPESAKQLNRSIFETTTMIERMNQKDDGDDITRKIKADVILNLDRMLNLMKDQLFKFLNIF